MFGLWEKSRYQQAPRRDGVRSILVAWIRGVEIQTAAAIMAATNTVQTYTSVTVEKPERPPATIFPSMQRLRSRQGVEAWAQLQDRLRELAALNKEHLIPTKAKK